MRRLDANEFLFHATSLACCTPELDARSDYQYKSTRAVAVLVDHLRSGSLGGTYVRFIADWMMTLILVWDGNIFTDHFLSVLRANCQRPSELW